MTRPTPLQWKAVSQAEKLELARRITIASAGDSLARLTIEGPRQEFDPPVIRRGQEVHAVTTAVQILLDEGGYEVLGSKAKPVDWVEVNTMLARKWH